MATYTLETEIKLKTQATKEALDSLESKVNSLIEKLSNVPFKFNMLYMGMAMNNLEKLEAKLHSIKTMANDIKVDPAGKRSSKIEFIGPITEHESIIDKVQTKADKLVTTLGSVKFAFNQFYMGAAFRNLDMMESKITKLKTLAGEIKIAPGGPGGVGGGRSPTQVVGQGVNVPSFFMPSAPSFSAIGSIGKQLSEGVSEVSKKVFSMATFTGDMMNSQLGVIVTQLASGASMAFGIISKFAGVAISFGSILIDGVRTAFELATSLAKTVIGGALALGGAAIAAGYGAYKALQPAGEFEQYRAQLGNMGLMSQMPYYIKLAQQGPQDVGQVVRGAVRAGAFGLDTTEAGGVMQKLLDSSAMFKIDMEEVAGIVARVKNGILEQESINRLGIQRLSLEKYGVKFQKSGEVTEETKPLLYQAFLQAMDANAKGMALVMSKTWEGALSNFFDAFKNGMAKMFDGVLPYATNALNRIRDAATSAFDIMSTSNWMMAGEAMVVFAEKASNFIKSIDWKSIGDTIAKTIETASSVASKLFKADTWLVIMESLFKILKSTWTIIEIQLTIAFVKGAGLLEKAIISGAEQLNHMLWKPYLGNEGDTSFFDRMLEKLEKQYSSATGKGPLDVAYADIAKTIQELKVMLIPYKPVTREPDKKPLTQFYNPMLMFTNSKTLANENYFGGSKSAADRLDWFNQQSGLMQTQPIGALPETTQLINLEKEKTRLRDEMIAKDKATQVANDAAKKAADDAAAARANQEAQNRLLSQMLQELRIQSEFTSSELAESYFA